MKRWLILILVVVALVLVIAATKGFGIFKMIQGFKSMPEPRTAVSTAKAALTDWNESLTAVGSLRAERGADLSSEVAGMIDGIRFNSGDEIKEGDLLVHLRTSDEVAQLHSLQAAADLARTNLRRDKLQLEAKAIAQATVDSDEATLKSDLAQVEQQQAIINKKNIHAPFSGRLGIRQVDLGQYLNPGDKIVTLQDLDSLYVDFTLPQQALAQIARAQPVSATADAFPDATFEGSITALDPKVDADTRNVQVRATLKNPGHQLLPGMFVNVGIRVGQPQKYVTLPQTAVTYNPYGETVYVIVPRGQENADDPNKPQSLRQTETLAQADAKLAKKDAAQAKAETDTATSSGSGGASAKPKDGDASQQQKPAEGPPQLVARQLFVTAGPKRGDQVAILKGVKEGDEVVTSGQLKLRNGALVVVNNDVKPADDIAPTPQEQ